MDLFVSDGSSGSSGGFHKGGVGGGDGSHHLHFFGGAAVPGAEEDEGGRVEDRELAEELLERVREAATLPLPSKSTAITRWVTTFSARKARASVPREM